jgi:hypothetical protein
MTQNTFDRQDLRTLGDDVKSDVFHALLVAHEVKLLPEAYGQFLLTAITCYGLVVRAQLLDSISQVMADGKLTEERIDKTISSLCKILDREAGKLGDQIELINEVKYGPEGRH